jgi:Xaa-Pro aminopeptidase
LDNKIFKKRIAILREEILKTDIDTIIILSDENRMYLSGYTGEDGRYDESAGALIITADDLILACDSRYNTQAEKEVPFFSVVCYEKSFATELPEILKSIKALKVGFEAERLTFKHYETIMEEIKKAGLDVKIGSDNNLLKNIRLKKDEHEVSMIKKALKISEDSFLQLKKILKPGMTEKESAWAFEKLMRENGADSLSFDVIAACGENSALPHAIPGDRQIAENEPLLFDFGVRLNGYCSDTTRTLIMGQTTDEFEKIYNIVFAAQKMATEHIKPGIKASKIDKIARDYIDSTEYKGKFGHGLGHGVGIVIHESPRLSKFDDSLLEPGMIVTVEPGIYIPEWGGIRLENMVEVTEDGANVLNTLNYDDYLI